MSDVCDEKTPSEGPLEFQVKGAGCCIEVCNAGILTVWIEGPTGREERDNWTTGKTLTSAPVSTKRHRPLVQSVKVCNQAIRKWTEKCDMSTTAHHD